MTARRACGALLLAAAVALSAPVRADVAPAPVATPPAADNARLLREAFAAWAAGTGSVFDLLHEDVVWTVAGHSPVSGTYASRADFMAQAVAPITARLATAIRPDVRAVVAQDDAVVVVWDGVATSRTGATYRNTYAWHMVFAQGRIVRVIAFLDTWALAALLED